MEACDTLVAAMTSEEYKNVVIIIAGYPAEIDDMLNKNAGLRSRFTNFFEFPDWQPEDYNFCKSKRTRKILNSTRMPLTKCYKAVTNSGNLRGGVMEEM